MEPAKSAQPPAVVAAWLSPTVDRSRAPDSTGSSATEVVEAHMFDSRNGSFINKPRVSIEGRKLEERSSSFGTFQLADGPCGDDTVRAVLSGNAPTLATTTVSPDREA